MQRTMAAQPRLLPVAIAARLRYGAGKACGVQPHWASVVNPFSGETVQARSLLSQENLRTFVVDIAKTMTGFAPVGYGQFAMLGAGVAQRTKAFVLRHAFGDGQGA